MTSGQSIKFGIKFPEFLTIFFTLILMSPSLSPFSNAAAENRIKSDDFEVLEDLTDLLSERNEILNSNLIPNLAEPKIEEISNSVSSSESQNPILSVENVTESSTFIETRPPNPVHPSPYELLTNTSDRPPGFVENIWQTLFNITEYIIWTKYTDSEGNEIESFEPVTFSASLISLLRLEDALLHSVDVNNDNIDDIDVGLRISWNPSDGWGFEDGLSKLWIEPGIQFSIKVIDEGSNDEIWSDMNSLQVSLIKAFSYSDPDSIANLGGGESYVWVIDSRFTHAPENFLFEVGIERFYFDLSTSTGFAGALLDALNPFTSNPDPNEEGIAFAAISSPYSLRLENSGQTDCPERYDPSELTTKSSIEISCGVSAGFGYIHFSPPDNDGERDLWELAYIEARFHPSGNSLELPSSAEVVIRSDSVLPTSTGLEGERSLTTIEYWGDKTTDLFIHFHEDRSNLPESQSDGEFGNATDSIGWLRGMPAGSMSSDEIERIFRMLGSAGDSELPGNIPDNLGFIIGIKNFTRDTSQNVNDPTLPVNPSNPPDSMILLRSVQPIESLEYYSWLSREGQKDDHRRIFIKADQIPTALVIFGSFGLGGEDGIDTSLDSESNLDFFSRIMDSVILNIVDLFLDVGNILNTVPSTVVDLISGGVGAGSISGQSFTVLLTDNWRENRNPFPLESLELQIGSSNHPKIDGNHLILGLDRDLENKQTQKGLMQPLTPVAASIKFDGFQAFSFTDSKSTGLQHISIDTVNNNAISLSFIEHFSSSLVDMSHQSVTYSNFPNNITLVVSSDGVEYSASSNIESIAYSGQDSELRQAAVITDFPDSFSSTFGDSFSWSSQKSIGSIQSQLSDSATPVSMSGNHFLFHHDPENDTSSLSSRISDIKEVGWIPPIELGASGAAGMGTSFGSFDGLNAFKINVGNAPTKDKKPLTVLAEIDPLPSTFSLNVPTGLTETPSLELPELNSSSGMTGIAFFISGFSDLGRSVNSLLSDFTTNLSTGTTTDSGEFEFGIQLDADTEFDFVLESSMGDNLMTTPEWVHGISLTSSESGISDSFHIKSWMPNLPPLADITVRRAEINDGERWSLEMSIDGWKPRHSELMLISNGLNGQDVFVTIQGLERDTSTSLSLNSEFNIRTVGGITEISTSSLYSMSNELDWFHAILTDRNSGSRTEMMVKEIPKEVEIQASLGEALSIDMTVPENHRKDGFGIGSIMIQQMQWLDELWWPATMFLTNVPGSMNLSTEPDTNFDITENLAFQGIPVLDFSASRSGMSLFIEAQGRAINNRGDILLMAEGMTDRLVVKPTDSFGLNVRSGGEGVGKFYLRASNIPAIPPVTLDELEVLGENVKSSTIHIKEVAGPYSVIELKDVESGRIIAAARAYASIGDRNFDLRGVILDAQTTSGIPTITTVGMNGMASDLSLLTSVTGMEGKTSHIMAPEPISSGILTVIYSLAGD